MVAREVLEPFAHDAAHRKETSAFRSTWLASSLRTLRQRELVEKYRTYLAPKYHPTILESVALQWLPIDVAVAHYGAMDRLCLPTATAFAMGNEIQSHAQSLVAQVAVRMSREVGVTPWTIFGQVRKLWDRTWRGGDLQVSKMGPKEAEVDIAGWTVASSTYVRHSMRGVLEGIAAPFCTRVYARELPERSGGTSLAFRIAWV